MSSPVSQSIIKTWIILLKVWFLVEERKKKFSLVYLKISFKINKWGWDKKLNDIFRPFSRYSMVFRSILRITTALASFIGQSLYSRNAYSFNIFHFSPTKVLRPKSHTIEKKKNILHRWVKMNLGKTPTEKSKKMSVIIVQVRLSELISLQCYLFFSTFILTRCSL